MVRLGTNLPEGRPGSPKAASAPLPAPARQRPSTPTPRPTRGRCTPGPRRRAGSGPSPPQLGVAFGRAAPPRSPAAGARPAASRPGSGRRAPARGGLTLRAVVHAVELPVRGQRLHGHRPAAAAPPAPPTSRPDPRDFRPRPRPARGLRPRGPLGTRGLPSEFAARPAPPPPGPPAFASFSLWLACLRALSFGLLKQLRSRRLALAKTRREGRKGQIRGKAW